MPKVRVDQVTFTAGVLDPKLAARGDLRLYFQGLERGDNIEFAPQGGARRRAGLVSVAEVRPELLEVDLANGVVTLGAQAAAGAAPPPPPPPPPPEPPPELPPGFDYPWFGMGIFN
jgi:hypothetical protein